jgi:CshA-type fibril repeat protein
VATPVTYQVVDLNGTPARAELTVSVDAPGPPVANLATATLTVTIAKPAAPTAKPDTATGKQNVRLVVDPTYRITDDNGTTAEGLLFLTVGKGPEAAADAGTTKQNVTVTLDPLANDKPGTDAELEKTSVQVYAGQWGRAATVSGQGTFTVDEVTGRIKFDPLATFRGVASFADRVTDSSRNTTASTVAVTVQPVLPLGVDDKASTPFEIPVTVSVVANDKPGDAWVTDANGSSDAALLEVTVADPILAKASEDTGTGTPGNPVAVNPLLNDGAGSPSTVCLRTGPATCTKQYVDADGTWSVDSSGTIKLVPAQHFTGTAKVTYEQTDADGTTVTAPVRFRVGAQPSAEIQPPESIPATGGPPAVVLTLGALLTALGATLAAISRRSR